MRVPVKIDRFLGLNESKDGDTNLLLGEASICNNFRITPDFKLKKLNGYAHEFDSLGSHDIRGMWYGKVASVYQFVFACNGFVWAKNIISDTDYDSIDNATHTNVSVVKTTAFSSAITGTSAVDNKTIYNNSLGFTSVEIAAADIDNHTSIGKYYYHTDKTVWVIVGKTDYADIGEARTGLGTTAAYYQIGALTDDITSFFRFDTKLYIKNGNEYLSWDGTTNLETVSGYRPLTHTATPPSGGGSANEGINLLTGEKHQTFNGDGVSVDYQLAEEDIDSVDFVEVGGVLKTITTDYTVNLTTGVVTFVVFPVIGEDNIDIGWTKGSGSRSEIINSYYIELYGGKNDTRVFTYGDDSNTYYYSGLAAGVPSAEYFPALYYREVGSTEHNITALIRQYDTLIIFKTKESWYSNYDPVEDGSGNLLPDFPTYPLNKKKGHIVAGQAQLVNNNPYSIMEGVYTWVASNVRDEKNGTYISLRAQKTLDSLDLSTAITYDFEYMAEYWLCVGNIVVVHNYRTDTWYKLILTDTPTSFIEINNELYFGTSEGQVQKFDTDLRSFDSAEIDAEWHMGFYAVELEYLIKYLDKSWISLFPESKSKLDVYWATNKKGTTQTPKVINYNNLDFALMDFSDFSFTTNYNPQPFFLKTKVKKWVYFKFILKSKSDIYAATVLNINFQPNIGGDSK